VMVEEFVNIAALIYTSTSRSPDIFSRAPFHSQLCKICISTSGGHASTATIHAFYRSCCVDWDVGQSPRMHRKSMLSINDARGGCSLSSGSSLFLMQKFGRGSVSDCSP